jgi:hypothetical protein
VVDDGGVCLYLYYFYIHQCKNAGTLGKERQKTFLVALWLLAEGEKDELQLMMEQEEEE